MRLVFDHNFKCRAEEMCWGQTNVKHVLLRLQAGKVVKVPGTKSREFHTQRHLAQHGKLIERLQQIWTVFHDKEQQTHKEQRFSQFRHLYLTQDDRWSMLSTVRRDDTVSKATIKSEIWDSAVAHFRE